MGETAEHGRLGQLALLRAFLEPGRASANSENCANLEEIRKHKRRTPARFSCGNLRKPAPWALLRPLAAFDRRRRRPRPAPAGEAEFHSFDLR